MTKGDIILIMFPFTDLSGSKLRPAVVLADINLDITVCFVTTQTGWQEPTDVVLLPNVSNGLKKPSLIRTGKIATLEYSLAKGLLGKLAATEMADLNNNSKFYFNFPDEYTITHPFPLPVNATTASR